MRVFALQLQRSPAYFRTLLDILNVLINFFYGDKLPQDETLLKMQSLLQVYAADSADLVSRYFRERHREQKALQDGAPRSHNAPNLGSITIRCQMLNEHLRVEVLNARNLRPPDPQAGTYIQLITQLSQVTQ